MKGCARTCVLWLVGWAVASYGFYLHFRTLGDLQEGLYWASAFAGLFVVLAVAYLLGIGQAARERAKLLDSINGGPPEDGKWIAVSGRISSIHRLTAPLTRENVVAYSYNITRTVRSGKSTNQVSCYSGKALVPSTIATRHGSVRLLAVPAFDFSSEKLDHGRAVANARQYIETTQFTTPKTGKERTASLESEWTDDDGNYRFDQGDPASTDYPLESCQFDEKHIKQGEPICAFGLYSQQKGGIVPHPNWAKQMKIMRGDAETVAGKLRARMIKYFIGVLVFGGLAWATVKLLENSVG